MNGPETSFNILTLNCLFDGFALRNLELAALNLVGQWVVDLMKSCGSNAWASIDGIMFRRTVIVSGLQSLFLKDQSVTSDDLTLWSGDHLNDFGQKFVKFLEDPDPEQWIKSSNDVRADLCRQPLSRRLLKENRSAKIGDFLSKTHSSYVSAKPPIFLLQEVDVITAETIVEELKRPCSIPYKLFWQPYNMEKKGNVGLAIIVEDEHGKSDWEARCIPFQDRSCLALISEKNQTVCANVHLQGYPTSVEGNEVNPLMQKNLNEALHYANILKNDYPNYCIVMAGDYNRDVSEDVLEKRLNDMGFFEPKKSSVPTSSASFTSFMSAPTNTIDRAFIYHGDIADVKTFETEYSDHKLVVFTTTKRN
jgi:hypothetical protein